MANKIFNTRVKNKRDTEANWKSKNPVLLDGEIIIVTTTSGDTRFKVGDGNKTYNQLPFQDQKTRDLIPSVDSSLSSTSTNPVQNKIIKSELDKKAERDVVNTTTNGLMSVADKKKLDGIATGATKVTVDTALSSTSTNPVQNKVINSALSGKAGTAVATTSANGLMSAADKKKLNGIAAGATANSASDTTPKAAGTASVGSETAYARGDHVHPSDTAKVSKSGDTMTGELIVPNITVNYAATFNGVSVEGHGSDTYGESRFDFLGQNGDEAVIIGGVGTPTVDTNAANKAYVDSRWGEMQQYVNTEMRTTAPAFHASSENTYGVGTDSEYGHVKLSDSYDYVNPPGISDGIAATPTALKGVWSFAKTAADRGASVTTTANNNISWTYRKWGNGFVECWGTFTYTNIAVTTAWGSIYESAGQKVSFPGGLFKKAPTFCSITYGGGSEAALSIESFGLPSKTETQTFCLTRAAAGTIANAKVLAYVVGEWM